ncbi:MAG TPA: hypothetical protein PLQ04_01595 [Lachnospiraceae bacterium]|nr:hypothetical protein [Lachnospiraceae bacterium]
MKLYHYRGLLYLGLAIFLSVTILLIYNVSANHVEKVDPSDYIAEVSVKSNIELISMNEAELCIDGWCYEPDTFYEFFNYGAGATLQGTYLNNKYGIIVGQDLYILPTRAVTRDDIYAIFCPDSTFDYSRSKCGLSAHVPEALEDKLAAGTYELVIVVTHPNKERGIVYTGQMVEVGK